MRAKMRVIQEITVFCGGSARGANATAHAERQCENVLSDTGSTSVVAVPSVPSFAVITGSDEVRGELSTLRHPSPWEGSL